MTFFDEEFIAYAGTEIMSRTIIAFVVIMCALRFFDMLTDSTTKPSRSHMMTRGLIAFTVPFIVVFMFTYANTLPSAYRTYESGTYEAGKTLPAGAYFLYSNGLGASVTIEGENGKTSHRWTSGNLGATIYEGDKITFEGCVAKNKTAGLTYSPGAATKHIAIGTTCLVGGVDLQPGTYELKSLSDNACYEVREGYLESGSPIDSEKFDGIAYADVHFGDVLYISGASATLYSNTFSLARPDTEEASAATDGNKDKADGGNKQTDKKADATDDTKADNNASKSDDRAKESPEDANKEATPEATPDGNQAAEGKDEGKETHGQDAGNDSSHASATAEATTPPLETEVAGPPADMATASMMHGNNPEKDVTGDGKVDAEDFIRTISVLPVPPAYDPLTSLFPPALSQDAGGSRMREQVETTDDGGKKQSEATGWSFRDAIRDIARESKRAVA